MFQKKRKRKFVPTAFRIEKQIILFHSYEFASIVFDQKVPNFMIKRLLSSVKFLQEKPKLEREEETRIVARVEKKKMAEKRVA